jgi:hypothetical protein
MSLVGLLAAVPAPTPTPVQDLDTTGGGGSHSFEFFVVSFLLAIALIGIGVLQARQLRRMNRNYRRKVEAGELPPERLTPGSQGPLTPRPPADGAGRAPGGGRPADTPPSSGSDDGPERRARQDSDGDDGWG